MADKTSKFESAQALFCAIADLVGKNQIDKVLNIITYPTYEKFEKGKVLNKTNRKRIDEAAKYIDTTADLDVIEEFLSKNTDWYKSSVKIAKKLIISLHAIQGLEGFGKIANPKFLTGQSAVHYFRGDADVMNKIKKLYDIANDNAKWLKAAKQGKFGDINKWSPADIYYASLRAKTAISTELADANGDKGAYHFGKLNNFINGLLDKGQLLPLSLKKQMKDVTIKKINFEIDAREKMINGAWVNGKLEGGLWYHSTEPYQKWRGDCGTTLTSWHYDRQPFSPFEPKKDGIYGYKESPARDVKINISEKHGGPPVGQLQIRHEPSSEGFKAEFKYTGLPAKEGGISSWQHFGDILSVVNPVVGTRFLNHWKTGDAKFKSQVNTSYTNPIITKEWHEAVCCGKGPPKSLKHHKEFFNAGQVGGWWKIYKLGKKEIPTLFPSGWKTHPDTPKEDKSGGFPTPYTTLRGEVSAVAVMNEIGPVIVNWIEYWKDRRDKPTDTTQVDEFLRLVFRYLTVQSKISGKFVIAK